MRNIILSLVLCAVTCNAFAIGGNHVHAAVPSGLPRPLLFEEVSPPTGVVPEYTQALLDLLGAKGTVSLLPHYRALNSLRSGRADFSCYSNRDWDDKPNELAWSEMLFYKREVILGPAPMPKHLKDLKGKTIGTMLGYKYPNLEPFFKSKALLREDAPNDVANFSKMQTKRIEYLVVDEVFLDYAKKDFPQLEHGRERLFVQQYPVNCSMSKKSSVSVAALNEAIGKLKSSGKLEAIFKKHGLKLYLK